MGEERLLGGERVVQGEGAFDGHPAGEAEQLRAQGWVVERRSTPRLLLCARASLQTRNRHGDLLCAALDYARRQGWIDKNPLMDVRRAGRRHDRERILRRDDFYDTDEVARLLIGK